MTTHPRILIADDHPLYRAALSEIFQRSADFQLVAAVKDLAAALDFINQNPCDLAILDLNMPGMEGLGGVAKLQARAPGLKIALISGAMDDRIIAAGMKVGIVGFLPKSYEQNIIVAAVKLMLTGETYVPYELRAAAKPPAVSDAANEATGDLTERERTILLLMARGAAHKEIGRELGLAEVTVKLHTQRIVRKLGVKNRAAAIAKAVQDRLIDLSG
jgi:two-component system nitrate/nitrite response regulator NarL